jgi:hypothetical protein
MLNPAMRHEPARSSPMAAECETPARECGESDPRKNESRQGRHVFRTAEERRKI